MTRRFIGVRWWLGAAFAVVAAVSTAIVVSQYSSRSETAFRVHAEQLAAASAPAQEAEVRQAARAHRRRVLSTDNGGIVVIGVPLGQESLVALSRRPDVAAAVGILNDQALRAGVIAGVIGVLVGLLLAQLIALRLRRLSAAAEAIAHGDFDTTLHYRVRDEFGALAQSFDRMRRQLRRSFRHIEGERDRLRLLLERLHEGVVTVDQQLVVQFANSEARRVLGTRLTEGDQLPEPWLTFSLREFAASLFDPGSS